MARAIEVVRAWGRRRDLPRSAELREGKNNSRKPKVASVQSGGRTLREHGGSWGDEGGNMLFELVISGLCAFVLSPCAKQTETVSAVLLGGPLRYPSHKKSPEHYPTLTVDADDVDPSSTAVPVAVVEDP